MTCKLKLEFSVVGFCFGFCGRLDLFSIIFAVSFVQKTIAKLILPYCTGVLYASFSKW